MVGIMLLLRSRVPLPPGPFLPVVQLRCYFEFDLDNCRTKPAINSEAATVLCSKKLQRYFTLSIIMEMKYLIRPNRHEFYNLSIAARTSKSFSMP
jgi:hypothetical protein